MFLGIKRKIVSLSLKKKNKQKNHGPIVMQTWLLMSYNNKKKINFLNISKKAMYKCHFRRKDKPGVNTTDDRELAKHQLRTGPEALHASSCLNSRASPRRMLHFEHRETENWPKATQW